MENTDFKYTSRDISWLHFNYRVLQEAMDKSVPLYERVKFLAIYSSNLDEFFRVRVAYLRSFKSLRKEDRKRLLDIKPKKVLKEILALVQWQQRQFGRVFREEVIPALQEEGIYLVTQDRIGAEQLKFIHQYFEEKVLPLLERKAYVEGEPAPFLENRQLYFVIDHGEEKPWEVVNIPSNLLPRFLVIPSSNDDYVVMYLDDVIRAYLPQFLGEQEPRVYSVKVSRDAELYIDDEYSGDLLDKIKASLAEREVGLPTRFLFDQTMPESLVTNVRKAYGLSKYDMIPGGRYHNFNDFFGFPEPAGKEDLHDRKLIPLAHPRFENANHLLSAIRERDELLHFPYQEYNYIPQLIKEAAQDPDVHTLRITLYRVAAKSDVVDGLLQALALGKKVEVFVEAKARFDEAANLYWGEELKKAGADVRYSFPGIKVHTKLLLIECTKQRDVSYLGTGNFNEQTARLYADHALLTADEEMTFDVRQVFELLTGRLILPATKHLLVAPFDLRNKLVKKINREIKHAKAGREAFIRLKMNSLEEQGMIEKLYQASNAGVKIQLIIRGICCLVPGVEGQSENIEVISILDRFLEHARIYYFFNDGKEELFTASADWMSRNLFRRVEVAIPIYDQRLRQELKDLLDIQWADNCKARIINAKQDDRYRLAAPDEAMRRSQVDYYEYLRSQLS
ncbi:MAG: polyphosphate kinase 1 [Lewinella sp.]|uniref:polyphosphate kinase 1 n=1 Tax=Lewinella sp. TaxID=2004506 RepID=UPI003D6C01BA